MIEYIRGELTELTPAMAVVEAAGVGYALNISLNTYTCIQGKKDVKLYVHEALVTGGRDDSFTLFGFATKQERDLYRLLISVSGVGGNTARMMLSSLSPAELCNAIANADERLIKSIKGIGLKTAQRIIVELKDKMATGALAGETLSTPLGLTVAHNQVQEEALAALTALGFQASASQKVVAQLIKKEPTASVETIIKLALKQL